MIEKFKLWYKKAFHRCPWPNTYYTPTQCPECGRWVKLLPEAHSYFDSYPEELVFCDPPEKI